MCVCVWFGMVLVVLSLFIVFGAVRIAHRHYLPILFNIFQLDSVCCAIEISHKNFLFRKTSLVTVHHRISFKYTTNKNAEEADDGRHSVHTHTFSFD